MSTSASFAETGTVGAPASVAPMSGSGQTAAVGTAFASPLIVTVKDAGSNPVSGATVVFAGTGVSFPSGATAVTNSNGQAQVTAQPTSVGALTVTASVAGVSTPAIFAQTGIAGAPASLAGVSGSGQSSAVGIAFASPLVVIVKDAGSNPVSGATVTFAGTGVIFPSGATAVTNSSGLAQVAAQPTTAGALIISASVAGVSTAASFAETGTVPVTLTSVTLDSGYSAAITVHLSGPATSPVVVSLSASDTSVLYAPPTVTVPTGQSSAKIGSFLGSLWGQTPWSKTVTLTAVYNGVTQTLTNTFGAPGFHSVGCGATPCPVKGGNSILFTVDTNFGGAPYGGATIQFISDNTAVIPNQSYNMVAGEAYVNARLTTNAVSIATTVNVAVKYNGLTATRAVQVTP